jgi:hypothetical protein
LGYRETEHIKRYIDKIAGAENWSAKQSRVYNVAARGAEIMPPSMIRLAPVVKPPPLPAKKRHAEAMSCGRPAR